MLLYYGIPGRGRAWRRFYQRFVQPGDLVFDAGAHVGSRSRALLACGARVVALEPQPLLSSTIRRLLGRHPQLTLDTRGLGAESGSMRLQISRRTPTVSTLSNEWAAEVARTPGFDWVQWEAGAQVSVTTLDALIAKHGLPAFCKLDIEGYEAEALRGLSQPVPALSFEYVPAAISVALDCIARLEQLAAYEYNLVMGEYPRLAFETWITPDALVAILAALGDNERAGEVYARRIT